MKERPFEVRLKALRRFALAITVFNLLGHTLLGFEQSLAQPLTALAVAYSLEILLELTEAWAQGRANRFTFRPKPLVEFLLPAHITGLATAMLLYSNDRLWPVAFATAAAIGSKWMLRMPTSRGTRHFLNPSNSGIALTLLLFPWVGIAPPYHFTENLSGSWNWVLPALIVISGTHLNLRLTGKMPLILSWLGVFLAQAVLRSLVFDFPLGAALLPMTGVAFILFTFYMLPDPGTTPFDRRGQMIFGASVAAAYSLLMALHVVFGLFFALAAVCLLRGAAHYSTAAVPSLNRPLGGFPVAIGRVK